MSTAIIITAIAAGSFLAGYLLRGLLAVALERKRRQRPMSVLSDSLVRGLADLAHNQRTTLAREADLALLDELRHRDGGTAGDHRATGTATARLAASMPEIFGPGITTSDREQET